MKVKFWGVRGSIPTPGSSTVRYGGNTACVTVRHKGSFLILDAGTGLRKLGMFLQNSSFGRPLEMHMLLSHTHWDHIQGLPFFIPAFVPGNTIHVHGMAPSEKSLERVVTAQMDEEYFPVGAQDLGAKIVFHEIRETPLAIGPFSITTAFLNHPGITIGYRIEADGQTLTYATDTEPFRRLLADHRPTADVGATYGMTRDQEIVRLAKEADLYIADSQYTVEEYTRRHGWGHSSYRDAVHMAMDARAKRLALYSHDPSHDDRAIDQKASAARLLADVAGSDLKIFSAAEGQEIDLDARVEVDNPAAGDEEDRASSAQL